MNEPSKARKNNLRKISRNASRREKELLRVARQIILKSFTQHPVLVTTTFHWLSAVEPKKFLAHCPIIAVANDAVQVSPQRPFYIYESKLSQKEALFRAHGCRSDRRTTDLFTNNSLRTPERFSFRYPQRR